jgi:hypothetical protein
VVVAREAGAGRVVAGKSVAGKSVAGKSVAGKSVAGKSVTGKSVTGKSVTGKSVAGKSVTGDPFLVVARAGEEATAEVETGVSGVSRRSEGLGNKKSALLSWGLLKSRRAWQATRPGTGVPGAASTSGGHSGTDCGKHIDAKHQRGRIQKGNQGRTGGRSVRHA